MSKHVVILGGGLAGLSCGYEMAKAKIRVTILEREPRVGGMASSFEEGKRENAGQLGSDYWCYDYGPHRFHTKEKELMRHVQEIIGDNKIWAKRQSRIFMFGKFFDYPLNVKNILTNMSPLRIVTFILDYVRVRFLELTRLKRYDDKNFKDWVTRRFGASLANVFFVQYTEKAWGMSAEKISADWASQRITLLNLRDTIMKTIFRPKNSPRTLVTDFVYPEVGGIGELARGYERHIREMGGEIFCGSPAILVHMENNKVTKIEYQQDGKRKFITADDYISTIPVTALARSVRPKAPDEVYRALKGLDYVAIVFVYLKINKPKVTNDNWVYLPEKELTIHRISEFKNFSSACAPPDKTMLCAEITCRVGDKIWKAKPQELRKIAVKDLTTAGLIREEEVIESFTKKIPFAYPIYDLEYAGRLKTVMDYVHAFENITSGGRQGLFRYNNMDQSIEMGRMMGKLHGKHDRSHEQIATVDDLFEPDAMDDLYRDEIYASQAKSAEAKKGKEVEDDERPAADSNDEGGDGDPGATDNRASA